MTADAVIAESTSQLALWIRAAYNLGHTDGEAAERQRIRQLAQRLDAEYPDYWGNPAKFADLLGDSDE